MRNRAGEVVGRIAAFYNREKASLEEQPTGGCGFFESIDDQQVADMLFEASRMWLASRGMEAMDGPINFGQRRDWWGLLVEGYEFQPLYKNPYNPPYYKELFENYGFKNYFNQHSFIWRVNDSEANKQIFARAERLYTVPGYRVENIDMNNLEEAAESFRVIYNKAWALFSGVKPMTQEEALEMVREMKPIIDPNIIFFAYFNEEPIGFFITVPDLNRLIGKFNGKFGLRQKLRLMWDLKVRKSCDRIFGIIFGICWISTCIERVLPFTLPASIIGMLLLLALLLARVIKTEHIREKSDYLLGNLPFFFIPASVSIINYADVLRENLLALVVVCAVSLIATFAATVGAVRLTCRLLERGKRR